MHGCGLHFILGNKGACKSMLACKLAWKVVAETDKVIVTNLPVVWDGLEKYMLEVYPSWTGKVRERVWVMEDLWKLTKFWLHVGFGWTIPDVSEKDWDLGRRLDFTKAYRWKDTLEDVSDREGIELLSRSDFERHLAEGAFEVKRLSELPRVQFIIDEMQNVFPARNWTKVGPQLMFFLTQQRHWGFDVIGISQRPGLMDKQLRELADDWLFLTNWKKKQKGWFRMPSRATWAKYDQLPGPGVKAMVSGNFSVDIHGVGATYDTSAGIGIEGGLAADKDERTPGLHWSWVLVAAAVGILLVMQLPGGLTWAMSWVLGSRSKGPVSAPAQQQVQPVQRVVPQRIVEEKKDRGVEVTVLKKEETRLTGLTTIGGVFRAFFSDGRVVYHSDRVFGGVIREGGRIVGCVVEGKEFRL